MPTLRQYRQRMYELDAGLGATYVIDANGVGARSITVTQLANGAYYSGWGKDRQLIRTNSTAVADRVRMSVDFDPISGRFDVNINATAYSDTTVAAQGDEYVEVLAKTVNVFDLDRAIMRTLRSTRFYDAEHLPMNQSGRYWLNDFSWITQPSHVLRVGQRNSAVITRNRHMEKWNGVSTGGVLVPDAWTLAGTGATFARNSTNVQRGAYSLGITTTGGNVATVEQTFRVMQSGVSTDSVRSATVTGVAVARSGTASSQRVRVTSEDAAGNVLSTTNASYHDGDDDWQELTAEHTVDAAAELIRLSLRQEQNETAEIDELYLVAGTLTDDIRRDRYGTLWIESKPRFEQGQPTLLLGPANSARHQLVIETLRPFHTFDTTRVAIGSADGDSHDAPIDLVATGAIWRYYEARATELPALEKLSEVWRKKYRALAANFMYIPEEDIRPGVDLLPPATPIGARVR